MKAQRFSAQAAATAGELKARRGRGRERKSCLMSVWAG